jgi:hypothetical protein
VQSSEKLYSHIVLHRFGESSRYSLDWDSLNVASWFNENGLMLLAVVLEVFVFIFMFAFVFLLFNGVSGDTVSGMKKERDSLEEVGVELAQQRCNVYQHLFGFG